MLDDDGISVIVLEGLVNLLVYGLALVEHVGKALAAGGLGDAQQAGYMTSKGLKYICPVGYEKMVPSVPAASRALGGASHIDISMGADPGLYCLSSADIVTEVEAIKAMFHCDAKVVCAGGIGGTLMNNFG